MWARSDQIYLEAESNASLLAIAEAQQYKWPKAKLAGTICGHATDVIPTGGRSPERRDPLRFLCIQYLLKCNMSSSGREQLKT